MKRYMPWSILLSLVLVIPCAVAFAASARQDVIAIPCDDVFRLVNSAVSGDGAFLLSGDVSGNSNDRMPMMFECNARGEAIWTLSANDAMEGTFYRDAEYLDDGTIIALRTLPDASSDCVVDFIAGGQVVKQSKPIMNSKNLIPLSDGFIAIGIGGYNFCSIARMNDEGETLWQLDWQEGLLFNGVISRDGIHAVFGQRIMRSGDSDSPPTSVMIAFDDDGKILWRHDSASSEEFTGATWTQEGNIVVIGDDHKDISDSGELIWDPGKTNFIAEYNEEGELWRTYFHHYRDTGLIISGDAKSILPLDDGYLVSYKVGRDNQNIRLLQFNLGGNPLNEWDEYIGEFYTRYESMLHWANGKIYLISHGIPAPETPQQGEEYEEMLPAESRTTLKEIIFPQ